MLIAVPAPAIGVGVPVAIMCVGNAWFGVTRVPFGKCAISGPFSPTSTSVVYGTVPPSAR